MDIKERYQTDTAFKALVDVMTHYMVRAEFTPSEVRLAAMQAAINYEMMHMRRLYIRTRDVDEALSTLQEKVHEESKRRLSDYEENIVSRLDSETR